MNLVKEGKILLDIEEVASSNHATVISQSSNTVPIRSCVQTPSTLGASLKYIQFGTFKPVEVKILQEVGPDVLSEHEALSNKNSEEWILVTRRKLRKQHILARHVTKSSTTLCMGSSHRHPNKSNKEKTVNCDNSLVKNITPKCFCKPIA